MRIISWQKWHNRIKTKNRKMMHLVNGYRERMTAILTMWFYILYNCLVVTYLKMFPSIQLGNYEPV